MVDIIQTATECATVSRPTLCTAHIHGRHYLQPPHTAENLQSITMCDVNRIMENTRAFFFFSRSVHHRRELFRFNTHTISYYCIKSLLVTHSQSAPSANTVPRLLSLCMGECKGAGSLLGRQMRKHAGEAHLSGFPLALMVSILMSTWRKDNGRLLGISFKSAGSLCSL